MSPFLSVILTFGGIYQCGPGYWDEYVVIFRFLMTRTYKYCSDSVSYNCAKKG